MKHNINDSIERVVKLQAKLTEKEHLNAIDEARKEAVFQAISDISPTLTIAQYRIFLNMRIH